MSFKSLLIFSLVLFDPLGSSWVLLDPLLIVFDPLVCSWTLLDPLRSSCILLDPLQILRKCTCRGTSPFAVALGLKSYQRGGICCFLFFFFHVFSLHLETQLYYSCGGVFAFWCLPQLKDDGSNPAIRICFLLPSFCAESILLCVGSGKIR